MKDNIYRTIKNKKEAKKVIRGIRRTEKILKFQKFTHFQQRLLELVHNFQNRKKKIKFYDYEKEVITYVFKTLSVITYLAVFITSIIGDELSAKYSIMYFMILSTMFMIITLLTTLIVRKFEK